MKIMNEENVHLPSLYCGPTPALECVCKETADKRTFLLRNTKLSFNGMCFVLTKEVM